MVYSVEFCQIIWAIKDSSFGTTFFDPGASKFFTQYLRREKRPKETIIKRIKYSHSDSNGNSDGGDNSNDDTHGSTSREYEQKLYGSALGPDWGDNVEMKGTHQQMRSVQIEYNCELSRIYYNHQLPPSKYPMIVMEETTITQSKGTAIAGKLITTNFYL